MGRPATPNLRDLLVREALSLLDDGGVDGLNFRDLAGRVGLSRQAPYLHFRDRVALLGAVGASCTRQLTSAIEAAVAEADDEPRERVRAMARTYVAFARTYPHRREVMSGPHVAKTDSPELQEAAVRLFAVGRELVGACPRPCADVLEARRRMVILWASVQGVIGLGADRQIPPSVGATVDGLVEEAVEMLLRAWTSGSEEERR